MAPRSPITSCCLTLDFSALDFTPDLAAFNESDWVQHFNSGYHDGGWSGVALRASGGDARRLDPDHATTVTYSDTPLLARCPTIAALLRQFACDLETVRLLRLRPGGVIREHRDLGLSYTNGVARLHVPLLTSTESEFYLDNARVVMAQGTCWYLDFDLPHRVQNLGATDRIHLVIDARVNEWLCALIKGAADDGAARPNAPSSMDVFYRFRDMAVDDPSLTARLWVIEDPSTFVTEAVAAGHAHGFTFTPEDVTAAMQQGARLAAGHRFVV